MRPSRRNFLCIVHIAKNPYQHHCLQEFLLPVRWYYSVRFPGYRLWTAILYNCTVPYQVPESCPHILRSIHPLLIIRTSLCNYHTSWYYSKPLDNIRPCALHCRRSVPSLRLFLQKAYLLLHPPDHIRPDRKPCNPAFC